MSRIVFLSILILASCTTYQPMTERFVSTEVYDFRSFIKSGFYITTNPYYDKYEPLGLIEIKIYPRDIETKGTRDENYTPNAVDTKYFIKESISQDECLKLLVDAAKKLGANGICNFEATTIIKIGDEQHLFLNHVDYYRLKGFAIVIKN